jgi:hypothetical protein
MLKKQMEQYIEDHMHDNNIGLFQFEKDYAEKHQLLSSHVIAVEKSFHFQIIERCNKESEAVIQAENHSFLAEPVSFLKSHQEDFIYVEANDFGLVGVDAIALEFDDVFETYTALFGLKLQKKCGAAIKAYLDTHLQGDGAKYNVMFSGEDGLWDMNFALDFVEGFHESQSFEEVYELIYRFVFNLVEAVEEAQ